MRTVISKQDRNDVTSALVFDRGLLRTFPAAPSGPKFLASLHMCHQELADEFELGRCLFPGEARAHEPVDHSWLNGLDEGARLVAGGPGRPVGLNRGYFVRPTVFADVDNQMTIAREEIFGPVLAMIPFETEEEAIAIANDTVYGLTNYVQTRDGEKANRVALQLRSGMVEMNGRPRGPGAPFGGMKQSGNGREAGIWGLQDFMEVKAISDWTAEEL